VWHVEFVSVALVNQNAMRVRRVMLPYVACLAVQYYAAPYQMNFTIFLKIVIEPKMSVLIYSTIFISNISHSRKNWTS
jgi:hypothetical protein